MTTHSMVSLIGIGLACIALMVITATLRGYDTGLVTGAVGVITTVIASLIGIIGGSKAKEKKIKKFLESVGSNPTAESDEEV